MSPPSRIIAAFVAVLIVGSFAWAVFHTSPGAADPVYNGKHLTEWLAQVDVSAIPSNQRARMEAEYAIRHIGTNAFPKLLEMVRANDLKLKASLFTWAARVSYLKFRYTHPAILNQRGEEGFGILNEQAVAVVPDLIKIFEENRSHESALSASTVLAHIGPSASNAIPSLLRAASDPDEFRRNQALFALGFIHGRPETVVPVLITCLRDPDVINRAIAAHDLANFGANAKSAARLCYFFIMTRTQIPILEGPCL